MDNDSKTRLSRLTIIIAMITIAIFFAIIFNYSFKNISYPINITPTSQVSIIPTVSMTPVSLPPFPWPVPKPSTFEVLTLGSLGWVDETGITFQDVDERIIRALLSAGYHEKSYFGVPGGFAIVTRLEKMDTNGYPDYPNRWASSLAPISIGEFSLTNYLEALFGVPEGHYRVFVFVVSSESIVQSGTPAAKEEAQTWVVEGANKLPNQMKELPYTREHTITVYIYEFSQSGVGESASYNIPSDFTGRQHLERAGLWEKLNPPIITEEFDHDPGWNYFLTKGDENKSQIDFAKGVMTFNLSGKEIFAYYINENVRYQDVRLDIRAENRGRYNNQISLVCRYTEDGWYEFSIANRSAWSLYAAMPKSDGKINYYVVDGGNIPTLRDWNEANEYGMICMGNEIQLYINGAEIKTVHENRYAFKDGYVGINTSSFTDTPVIVDVDWFKISEP